MNRISWWYVRTEEMKVFPRLERKREGGRSSKWEREEHGNGMYDIG